MCTKFSITPWPRQFRLYIFSLFICNFPQFSLRLTLPHHPTTPCNFLLGHVEKNTPKISTPPKPKTQQTNRTKPTHVDFETWLVQAVVQRIRVVGRCVDGCMIMVIFCRFSFFLCVFFLCFFSSSPKSSPTLLLFFLGACIFA